MNPFLTCKELLDFLSDYMEGELADVQRAEFDRHLAVCPSCLNYLETFKATIVLGKASLCAADDDPPPPEVPEQLIQAILAARKKSG